VLEELLWENEWVEESHKGDGDNLWSAMDEAFGAPQGLRSGHPPDPLSLSLAPSPPAPSPPPLLFRRHKISPASSMFGGAGAPWRGG
jgi:hypothetical protein